MRYAESVSWQVCAEAQFYLRAQHEAGASWNSIIVHRVDVVTGKACISRED